MIDNLGLRRCQGTRHYGGYYTLYAYCIRKKVILILPGNNVKMRDYLREDYQLQITWLLMEKEFL